MSTRIAVPSVTPGGLEAPLMPHFGHCDVFTLVEIEDGRVNAVEVLPNLPHGHGDCTGPVNYLAEHGVSVMLAGGMGARPFQAFRQKGIEVFFAGTQGSVDQAVKDYTGGKLPAFGDNGLCKGGCEHH